MDRKQGFFSTLKEEVVRGLSPSRSRSRATSPARSGSPMSFLRRRKNSNFNGAAQPEPLIGRSGILRPVLEGPDQDDGEGRARDSGLSRRVGSGLGNWVMDHLPRVTSVTASAQKTSDLRLLLGVMGAPLAPLHVSFADPLPHLSIKDTPIETSSAQYILQQYTAASGGQKLQNSIRNAYAMGKLKMRTSELETATRTVRNRNASKAETGGFVLWQMNPDMWYVELSAGSSKVHAGCNGKLVWRHTPWLGAHTAKGPVRPLRRALQGLDPRATASIFADAKCIGEKNINNEDCFVLKLTTDAQTLKKRSEGPAEIIRHVLFGYFSQKTGLLVHIEDSHLTRIQSDGGDTVYWETTMNSSLRDYKPVEGIMVAHSGFSTVTLFRFGEVAMSHSKAKLEESWSIEEVAFNVPGLSLDCFIPPADLRSGSLNQACELPQDETSKSVIALSAHGAKNAALEKRNNGSVNPIWHMED